MVGIQPVAMQADIDVAAGVQAVHPQEQDLVGTAAGVRLGLDHAGSMFCQAESGASRGG